MNSIEGESLMLAQIPWMSFFGGLLIGCAALLLLALNGKIAGISGILKGAMLPNHAESIWKLVFALGVVAGGGIAFYVLRFSGPGYIPLSLIDLAIAGVLVGVGTRLANGCTSGHGICGLGRLSPRSVVATVTFMLTAVVTVFVRLHL
jgi:uncharacterized membrane protein YedE/YeeE